MSALEQIRKHPAITIGVIGFALILFLFTGIDGCNRFVVGDVDSAVTVDGKKIKINELRDRANQMNRNNQDLALVEQNVAQQMIDEALLDEEYEKLGIVVTNSELEKILFGENALPYFASQAQQYRFPTLEEFYQTAYSDADPSGSNRAAWENLENNVREQLLTAKFQSLLSALTVNKLDAKAYYDDNAVTSTFTMARKDYSTMPDADFAVTDNEVRDRYKQERTRYAIPTEKRLVDYIVVNITPSTEDYQAAQTEVEDVLAQLKSTPSTDAIVGNTNFEETILTGQSSTISDQTIKNNFDAIVADSVRMISFTNDTYTIAKLIDSYTANDSVYVDMLIVDAAQADSITNQLNAGTTVADLGNAILQSAENQGFSLIDPAMTSVKDQLIQAEVNSYFVVDSETDDPTVPDTIVRIVKRPAPVKIYEIAKITRQVLPSSTTYNNLNNELRKYVAANQTPKAFRENAADAGYSAQQVLADGSMLTVGGLPSSSAAAKWVMDAEKGKTSDVFTDNTKSYLLAVAVEDIYDDGYLGLTYPQVSNEIRAELIAEKKGDKLVNELKGQANSVESYAQKMGVAVETAESSFGSNYVRGFLPGDPAMLANVAVAEQGKLVGPIATRNSVVVFQVTDRQEHGREFNFDTDKVAAMQQEITPMVQRWFPSVLRDGKDIKYDMLRFYQDN